MSSLLESAPTHPSFLPIRPVRGEGASTGRPNRIISTYSALLETVKAEGLLGRRTGFYLKLLAGLTLVLGGCVAAFVVLGNSWAQLGVAAVLGLVFTQFSFVAHEASHRQVFSSNVTNDRIGRLLAAGVVGISYSWWMNKHTRHHGNPNTIGKDPDIAKDTISFLVEDAVQAKGLLGVITRRQGYLFFPLLLGEGANLHVRSIRSLLANKEAAGRRSELAILGVRLLGYLAVLFTFLSPGLAVSFLAVQLGVFGLYMGASFAPNHKGMPLIPRGSSIDFLSKQVLTSRNIRGRGTSWLLGGLNYQVEHHLFPSMPRPHLARAAELVRAHCAQHQVPYTETTLLNSYRIVIEYLNRVGLSSRDPFDCPTLNDYRRR